ncbi:hypothetical protein, partial [Cronobacter sakazakii]
MPPGSTISYQALAE